MLTTDERAALGEHSDIVAHLLFHRGITDAESARKFVSPDYDSGVHDPFLLKDAEKSAERIIKAVKSNERIAVYADYDADGIPGAALFDDFLKRIGYANYSIYIPHRHNEGFGLNSDAIEQLASEGVKLLITIDCGVTDAEPVKLAREKGMDVIITDHHEPPPELPPAFAIVDHKQADCAYPDKTLCGSGVAFKLIQAVLKKDRFGMKEGAEKWLLDLVGIATLSDMVPLTGENRIFAHFGLAVLRKSPRKGIMELLRKLKIQQRHMTEDDIAFMLTPRINAASRMGVPMDAFRLLAADNDDDAHTYAAYLDAINAERKTIVAQLTKDIRKTLHDRYGAKVPAVIVLGNPSWKPSLLGLAANTCAQEFDRPAFLWGRDGDDVIKGSCRSEGRSNVVELMRAMPAGTLSQFGGHMHSGGFAVDNAQIHYLEQRLQEAAERLAAEKKGGEDAPTGHLPHIDRELALDDVNDALFNDINRLAPFGVGNPKPSFIFKKVSPHSFKSFGKGNEHIEILFKAQYGRSIPAISFFSAEKDWAGKIENGKPLDMTASLERSMFRGRPELRLRIIEIFPE